MAVVFDTVLESELPATTCFGTYKTAERGGRSEVVHHHHFPYPSGYAHHLSKLSAAFKHKKHASEDVVSWTPDSDIRETKLGYHIEMELPGVSDKKDILIQWMLPRTMLVEGRAARPHVGRGPQADGDTMWESDVVSGSETNRVKKQGVDKSEGDQDGGPCARYPDTENEVTTKLLHGERRIGLWRRVFTLPVDSDMKTMKAGLEAGLLHISVAKKELGGGEPATRVEVEQRVVD